MSGNVYRLAYEALPLLARKYLNPGSVLSPLKATQAVVQMGDDNLARSDGSALSAQRQQRSDETERISAT
jgi:hypothetical protein